MARAFSREGSSTHTTWKRRSRARVFLNVLPILGGGGCAHTTHAAAGQGRLEKIGGVHALASAARAQQHVNLINEQHQGMVLFRLANDLLQPLFEVAAIFGSGHQRAE